MRNLHSVSIAMKVSDMHFKFCSNAKKDFDPQKADQQKVTNTVLSSLLHKIDYETNCCCFNKFAT